MNSTVGRPRKVTDTQVAAILEWWMSRKSLKQFAAEIGLPAETVQYVIGRRGQYKGPSPELRNDAIGRRRARMRSLAKLGWL